jgi:hypothetical protein
MKPIDGRASFVALFRSMYTAVVCNPEAFYLAVFKQWQAHLAGCKSAMKYITTLPTGGASGASSRMDRR